jgi:hypothetical protein
MGHAAAGRFDLTKEKTAGRHYLPSGHQVKGRPLECRCRRYCGCPGRIDANRLGRGAL